MISQATTIAMGLIDLYLIRHLGTSAMGAVAIANTVWAVAYNFLEGIKNGTTSLVSIAVGEKDSQKVSAILNIAMMSAIAIGLLFIIISAPLSTLMFQFVKDPTARLLGRDYLIIRFCELPFRLSFNAVTGFFRGLKNTVLPMMMILTVCAFNAVLDYACINGYWGFPVMGVRGAAMGTVLAYTIGVSLAAVCLYVHRQSRTYLNFRVPLRNYFKETCKMISEVGVHLGLVATATCCFAYIIDDISIQALAAHQIAFKFFLLCYLPPTGFLVTAVVITGKLFGTQQLQLLRHFSRKAAMVSFFIAIMTGGILCYFSPSIAHFFSPKDPQVNLLATQVLYIVAIMQVFTSIASTYRGILTGLKDTRFIVIESLITAYAISLPVAYILTHFFEGGLIAVYWSLLLWSLLDCIVCHTRLSCHYPRVATTIQTC